MVIGSRDGYFLCIKFRIDTIQPTSEMIIVKSSYVRINRLLFSRTKIGAEQERTVWGVLIAKIGINQIEIIGKMS